MQYMYDATHKKAAQKTETFRLRIDLATKRALQNAADAAGMSASALVLMAIKEALHEGTLRSILPEHVRLSRTEDDARRARTLSYSKSELQRRRREQRKKPD
jgi:antitoxin component of RelBE/YafQ-DinJ toxin-antitoxin module